MRTFFNTAKPVWAENEETQKHVTFGLYTYINKADEDAQLSIATSGVYRVFVNGEFFYTGPARCAHDFFRVDQIAIPTKEKDCHIAIELVNYYAASFSHLRQAGFVQAEITIGEHVFAATGVDGFSAVRLNERVKKVQRYSFQRPFVESYRLVPGVYDWHLGTPGKNTEGVRLCITKDKKLVGRNILPYTFPRVSVANCIAKGFIQHKVGPIDYLKDRGLTDVSEKAGSLLEGYEEANLEQHISNEIQEWDYIFKETASETYTGETSFKAGEFVTYEFPCDKTGFLSMNVECKTATQLYLVFDEVLTQDDVDPLRLLSTNAVRLDVLPGKYSFQTMESYGMRYLKIVAISGECVIQNIEIREMICPQPIIREYKGNDPELQRIYNAAIESFLQNSCDIFMDCPTRERAGWLCDSYFLGKTEFYLTGKNEIERNFLENYLLPEEFRDVPKGMVPMCYPADHLDGNFIPNWAMWLVLELSEFRERTGDAEFVDKFKERVYGIVNWFAKYENKFGLLEGLPKWNFIDWSMSNKLVRDVGFAGNMLYAFMLEKVGELYADEACAAKAQTLKETIRQRSYTGKFFCDNEVYQDGKLVLSGQCTETCQYYAFFTGVATRELYPELWHIIMEQFGPDRMQNGIFPEIHPSNAFIGYYLRMLLLNRYGKHKQMLEEIKGYFLYMADTTGTLWEMKDETGSCNHGFASYAAALIGEQEDKIFDLKKNYEVSRKLAAQGMVLLENKEQVLPTKSGDRVGIIGKECLNLMKGGGGSGNVKCEYIKSFADGLREKSEEGKLIFVESTIEIAEKTDAYDQCILNKIAGITDKVIITMQRQGTEGEDRKVEEFNPTEKELELLQNIEASDIAQVILILNFSNVVDLSFIKKYPKIKAVVFASMPGMECGSAIMDVVCGDVNPSGKLVDTIAYAYEDYPTAKCFDYDPRETKYNEGIYVGYRYFETFAKEKVLYPFGYGLSYTQFEYSNYCFVEDDGDIKITVDVTNVGECAGREVVQAYCSAPQGKLPKPAIELKGYAKTKELSPGEIETLTIRFAIKDMAAYDTEGVTGTKAAWILEKGIYQIYVAKSARQLYLCGGYEVAATMVTKQTVNRFTGEKHIPKQDRFTDALLEVEEKISLYDVSDGKADIVQFINQLSAEELVSLSLGQPIAFPMGTSGIGNLKKYGIPNPQTADGPVGVRRSVNTTCFPCSTLIACSWDQELQYAMGAAMGYEGYSTGIDILLGPAMNIHRDPLGGRNYEYFSEDPLISGKTAAALVNGMQSEGLCATLKHFAVNNCEYFRNINNSVVEERALREIYLKGFEIAVKESNPAYIMTSYNLLNGEHTSANAQLLRGILRDEWHYEGATMTDWRNGVSLVDEMIAGNNIKMPFGYPDEGEKVLKAYQEGKIPLWMLRENAFYVVNSVMKTRSFAQHDFGIIHKMEGESLDIPVLAVNGLASARINHATREDGVEYLFHLNREQRNQRSFVYYVVDIPKEGEYLVSAEISTNCPETQIWFYDENANRLGTAFCSDAIDENKWYTVETSIKLQKGENVLKLVFANEPYKEYEYFSAGPEIPNAWPELAKEDIWMAKLNLSYLQK